MAAGLAGSAAHSCLMILKSRAGLLPSFQPYDDLQRLLGDLVGGSVGPAAPWILSFANGSLVLGFLFGRTYRLLPGRSGWNWRYTVSRAAAAAWDVTPGFNLTITLSHTIPRLVSISGLEKNPVCTRGVCVMGRNSFVAS